MGAKTGIEWADVTWNPWMGCTPVSEGCAHCYMYRDAKRYGRDPAKIVRASDRTFRMPLSKTRVPPASFVFVCSWSDFFHEDVPEEWWNEAFAIMQTRVDVTYLLLTKRPENIISRFMRFGVCTGHDDAWARHIWLGVTAENQARADDRIPRILEIDWPGKRFVSVEPMLSRVHVRALCGCGGPARRPDWIIVGGESGPDARPMHPDWVTHIRYQCQAAGVPFMLKQWGEWAPDGPARRIMRRDARCLRSGDMVRVGRKRAGRELDGQVWLEFPDR